MNGNWTYSMNANQQSAAGTTQPQTTNNVPKTAGISSANAVIPTTSIVKVDESSHDVNQQYLLVGGVSVQYGIIDSVTHPLITSTNPVSSTLQGAVSLRPDTLTDGNPVPGNKF